jgi:hypothetical protein
MPTVHVIRRGRFQRFSPGASSESRDRMLRRSLPAWDRWQFGSRLDSLLGNPLDFSGPANSSSSSSESLPGLTAPTFLISSTNNLESLKNDREAKTR